MPPIHKDDLKGKNIEYIDRDGKFRIGKVIKISGNTLTVMNCLKKKTRVNLDDVKWWIRLGRIKEEIIRTIRRMKKNETRM